MQARNQAQPDGCGRRRGASGGPGILPEDADAKLRARVLEMLARRTMLSGDPQRGIEFSQQAVDAAALADSDSVTANAWITLGTSLAAAGQEDGGPRRIRAGQPPRSQQHPDVAALLHQLL